MRSKDWDEVKKNIQDGIFKLVRLVKDNGTKNPEIIVAFNKVTSGGSQALARLEYIRTKISKLSPGRYLLQCRLSPSNNSITENYEILIAEKNLQVHTEVEDHTHKQEEDMQQINLDDHIKLIRENAELRAMNTMLETEKNFYKTEYHSLRDAGVTKRGLSDDEEKEESIGKTIANTLENLYTASIPILEKHFDIQEKRIALEDKKMSSNKVKLKKSLPMAKKSIEDEAQDLADQLYPISESNPEQFDQEMDLLEEQDPEMYDLVCEILGIEETEEEEEQDENQ